MNVKIPLPLPVALAALALAACSPDFEPASRVEKLRVLAIQAEPPEIDPGSAGTLESLVLRADFDADPARTTTVVHLACVPVPGSAAPVPCVMLETLRDPAVAVADGARQGCAAAGAPGAPPWPTVELAGIEECVRGRCGPATVGGFPLPSPQLAVTSAVGASFAALPAGAPERLLGVQAVVLAFALEATADELVAGVGTSCPAGDVGANLARLWPAREHVLATKRVLVRGPDAPDPRNENPAIDGIFAGTTLAADAATVLPRGTVLLSPELPADADALHQLYTERDAAGLPIETAPEEWVYSWFATAGEIEDEHVADGESDEWRTGGAPARAVVAAVVRDLRGGVAWAVREVSFPP